ncbi:uncharacterized protein METZ01_LOCUS429120, partial [marine metagenome]
FYMTSNDGVKGSGDAVGSLFSLPNYPFRMGGHWIRTGSAFDPAMGFVRHLKKHPGGQSSGIHFSYAFDQPASTVLDDVSVGVEYSRYDLLDEGLYSDAVELKLLEVRTLGGDSFGLEVEFERKRLPEKFKIVDGVNLAAGDYRGTEFELEYRSSSKRPVFGELKLGYGDYYDGKAFKPGGSLSWRPSKHAQINLEADLTSADLPVGDFDVLTSSLGVRITPTTRLSFNSIVQYDNQSEQIGINNRFRYILKSGSDLFLVFNKGFEKE